MKTELEIKRVYFDADLTRQEKKIPVTIDVPDSAADCLAEIESKATLKRLQSVVSALKVSEARAAVELPESSVPLEVLSIAVAPFRSKPEFASVKGRGQLNAIVDYLSKNTEAKNIALGLVSMIQANPTQFGLDADTEVEE